MKLSQRILTKWRKEALRGEESIMTSIQVDDNWTEPILNRAETLDLCKRILTLTQELLDQHLLKKGE